jgi:hypothetical protein
MNPKKARLTKYVEDQKKRLSSPVPKKHEHRPEVYKDMLMLDIRKTLARIDTME